jgi:penicillin-binding protein 2
MKPSLCNSQVYSRRAAVRVRGAALLAAALAASICVLSAADRPKTAWKQALQSHLDATLHGRKGAAMLLAVQSNEVLALYRPSTSALRLVAPGSTIKPFTLMALVDAGKLPAEIERPCPIHLRLAGRNLNCTHPVSAEPFDAREALAWSCNNWFAEMALRLEPRELRAAFQRAGLFSRTGLVENEAVGSLRDVADGEELQLQAIGAANIHLTPLEMAAGYRCLALLRLDPAAAETYAAIFQGLENSVAYGMARRAQIDKALSLAGPLAGKTGTSTSGRGYTHAWFAGYWPSAAPEVVVVVFLERGSGGMDAAPLAREIIRFYIQSRGA